MAAEQPILYVTPATDNAQLVAHHSTTSLTQPNTNPDSTVENEQQASSQSDAFKIPTDALQANTTPPLQEYASTGRAVDYNRPAYNYNRLITPLIKSPTLSAPVVRARPTTVVSPSQKTSNIGQIVYPNASNVRRPPNRAEINKLTGKAQFSDRFTPGEATAAGQFAKHHKHNHAHKAANSVNSANKVAAASQIIQQTYKPPNNIYSFPPNVNAQYSSPYQDPKAALPSSNVNSYAPPPSGQLLDAAGSSDAGYKYAGPTNPDYLPPSGKDGTNEDMKKPMPSTTDDQKGMEGDVDADNDNGSDDTIGVLPASAMGDPEKDMDGKDAGMNMNNDGGDSAGPMADNHDHDHPPPDDDTEYPTPPPGWVEEHPDTAHDSPHVHSAFQDLHSDHHYDFHHDHLPSYPQYFHPYPQIIWDDHHPHHEHPSPPPPPPTLPPITTEIPPPEPPPEPRVKKYSYFYIGRKLWYIPLYFTVWFSFYVLWLILKSIARHKVNLPNHYVSRRSLPDLPMTQTQTNEYINDLTVSVLEKIENFQRKFAI
ncbi:PREDICTED: uncharacterized protein LOC108357921 [Rhagoletis zephyria]|uniref:uncharacterized protein LOC108357921 n=1 Tax=Rhagoletis zephyria TaxID=28612 RepID=UPI00081167C8|nr:PREDICTED: uncharacterized protein LOC108357921 [Rhagoletis zephyria]